MQDIFEINIRDKSNVFVKKRISAPICQRLFLLFYHAYILHCIINLRVIISSTYIKNFLYDYSTPFANNID